MSKLIPILFSTPMVQALLEGRKSMTRRNVKITDIIGAPDGFRYVGNSTTMEVPHPAIKYDERIYHQFERINSNIECWVDTCPYGKVGDILWVRETIYQNGELGLEYVADGEFVDEDIIPQDFNVRVDKKGNYKHCQIPNIFMNRSIARIFLKVTEVRVERLNDITDQDAIAEGIQWYSQEVGMPRYKDYMADASGYGDPDHDYPTVGVPACSFSTLWESINRIDSWGKNPWVWVIVFERCEKPLI